MNKDDYIRKISYTGETLAQAKERIRLKRLKFGKNLKRKK